MNKSTKMIALFWGAWAFSASAYSAQVSDSAATKAAQCAACHGQAGVSMNPLWPNLAGQKKDYLAKQLRDFKSDKRQDPLMSGMAKTLSDADIDLLANYYANLK